MFEKRISSAVPLSIAQHAFRSEVRQEVEEYRRRAGLPSLAREEAEEIRAKALRPEYARSKHPTFNRIATLFCYPVVFDAISEPIGSATRGTFREKIHPNCFSECLTNRTEIVVTVDHDIRQLIATNANPNDVVVSPDRRGLQVAINIPDTEVGRYVLRSLDDNRVRGMSFDFTDAKDTWADGVRTLTSAKLTGLSILINQNPAYSQTLIKVAERAQRHIESGCTRQGHTLGAPDSVWRE
jgi:HK97 family phage prohead protease